MPELGRVLLVLGLALAAVGGLLLLAPHLPWLGRLPGDIHVERENVRFRFPIVTCLVISVVLTLLWNLWSRWR